MSESAQAVEASTVHIRTTEVEDICEEVAVSLEHNSIDYLAERKKPLRARYIYGVIFLIMNLCAWFVRDYGQLVLPQLHCKQSSSISFRVAWSSEAQTHIYWMRNENLPFVDVPCIALISFCRSKILWKWRRRLFSYARSSSCQFRMFGILLLVLYEDFLQFLRNQVWVIISKNLDFGIQFLVFIIWWWWNLGNH